MRTWQKLIQPREALSMAHTIESWPKEKHKSFGEDRQYLKMLPFLKTVFFSYFLDDSGYRFWHYIATSHLHSRL